MLLDLIVFFFILQAICDESCDDPNIFFDGKVPVKIGLGSRVQIIDSVDFYSVLWKNYLKPLIFL